MKIRTQRIAPERITPDIDTALKKLQLGLGIWEDYLRYREQDTSQLIIARDVDTRKIVGWCFMFYPWLHWGRPEAHLYVHGWYRRRGIGTRLLRRAEQLARKRRATAKLMVWPHDKRSREFFHQFACT